MTLIIGQSIWDQYIPQSPWNAIWKNTFCLYTWQYTIYALTLCN